MLIPISWLKDYVDIKLPLRDLMWKMTEAGLTCETYRKEGDEVILDVEVTANRPDWMSIIGVAREIAAIQGTKIKKLPEQKLPEPKTTLPITLIPDYDFFERWAGLIIKDVEIKPSPKWLADRIRLMGHEPINNIIDITNYVMFELGIPMHAFDYDKIRGQVMKVQKSLGGEDFTSLDGIEYKLPKDAIIINDSEGLIDLAGIKGGLNSGIRSETKNIFLHGTIDNPVLVRRASIALGLRSEASAIYERGPDKGGVLTALIRAVNLILENAGGEVASEVIDLKKHEFKDWVLDLSWEKLEKVLGIKIPEKEVVNILEKLNLAPKRTKTGVSCRISTYRGDLKIEEDLIEEVARIYGYNKFPKTLPQGRQATQKVPYYFDDSTHKKLTQVMISAGYSETMNLSLISTELIENCLLDPQKHTTLENPVSLDYEHMRTSLIPSLLTAVKLNRDEKVRLFELDKIYPQEIYKISVIAKNLSFREFKGAVDLLLEMLNITDSDIEFEASEAFWHPFKSASVFIGKDKIGTFGEITPQVLSNLAIKGVVHAFEFDTAALAKHSPKRIYKTVWEFPPQIEDVTLGFPPKTRLGNVVKLIESQDKVSKAELKDTYKDYYTFRIWYQDPKKTLTDKEVEDIRKKILSQIKSKFGGQINLP